MTSATPDIGSISDARASGGASRVSIVIPTYNRAYCLVDAVQSCLAQGIPELEIVVVDDGSTDGTRETLDNYMDRIRYVRQSNSGVSAACNAGILAATGEYLLVLGSDDELLPGSVQGARDRLLQFPECVAHVGNVLLDAEDPGINLFSIRRFVPLHDPGRLARPLAVALRAQFFPQGVLFSKAAALRAGLFDTRLSLHEDVDFLLRLALEGPWVVSTKTVARVLRKGPASAALSAQQRQDPEATPRVMTYAYAKLLAHDNLKPFERSLVRKELSGALCWRARARAQKGEGLPRNLLIRSVLVDPRPKSVIRAALALLPASVGFRLIDWGRRVRRAPHAGFYRDRLDS